MPCPPPMLCPKELGTGNDEINVVAQSQKTKRHLFMWMFSHVAVSSTSADGSSDKQRGRLPDWLALSSGLHTPSHNRSRLLFQRRSGQTCENLGRATCWPLQPIFDRSAALFIPYRQDFFQDW